jgi:tellurite resistance protein TehA-like permease
MPSYSASPIGLPISAAMVRQKILSDVSDDAFYGIICAIAFLILYTSIHAIYYYKKYKKEKLRVKRFNELQGKINPVYRA